MTNPKIMERLVLGVAVTALLCRGITVLLMMIYLVLVGLYVEML